MKSGRGNAAGSASAAKYFKMILAVGIVVSTAGFLFASHNLTLQYSVILGGSILCLIGSLILLMRHLTRWGRDPSYSLSARSGWILGALAVVMVALLVVGTSVDQLKN